MPLFVVPDSNSEDASPVREFNPCHLPGGSPAGGQFAAKGAGNCEGGGEGSRSEDPEARAKAIEARLSAPDAVRRRMAPEPTAAEAADPAFRVILDRVRDEAETIVERQQDVPLARAYYESEQGMEGYPLFQEDGSPGASLLKHKGPVGGLTAERAALHDRIIDHFRAKFSAPQEDPIVVVTGGLPGAGKSFGLKGVDAYKGFLNLNADDVKAMLPEYNGTNAAFLHEESDLIARRIFEHAVAARQHLILDVTMKSLGDAAKGIRNGLAGRIDALAQKGYEVQLQFTEVSMDTSVRQAVQRFFEIGRFVPPNYIRTARAKGQSASSQNYETFRALRKMGAIRGWKHYTREFGEGAVLYEQGGRPR